MSLTEYIESRIAVQREIINKQTGVLPDMLAGLKIEEALTIIGELQLLQTKMLHGKIHL